MTRFIRILGSLKVAVPLLLAIAGVLAYGTIYEARLGTAAVQRVVYHAWWFQTLLGFLAVNLAVAALERYPWQRRHIPFVLAHIGIILILVGGILGGRFGIEGQLIIKEGQAERTMDTPGNVLVVHPPNSGVDRIIPTRFESRAWVHEPNLAIPLQIGRRALSLVVDRYYPDAVGQEFITEDGPQDNPGIKVLLEHEDQHDAVWLFSRESSRFGVGWGDAHVLFLEPQDQEPLDQLLGRTAVPDFPRGVVSVTLPGVSQARDVPVPAELNAPATIKGSSYRITFKGYFPDFAITPDGPTSRSSDPNNPAVAFTLEGPEGTDSYLLFALHPDFQTMHGLTHTIHATARYRHNAASAALPPNGIIIVRPPSGGLFAVLTAADGARTTVNPMTLGEWATHPSLGYRFLVKEFYPKARIAQQMSNRSNEVRMEALRLTVRGADRPVEAWVGLRGSATLDIGEEPITVEYRPGQRDLPFTVKLLDFRKTDYPGTQMPAAFESDVEMSDPSRGLILMRTIKMNQPLRYRGYHLYQSSYVPGEVETTILSVRNDPGTPFVYAGFLIVIGGVVTMFIFRAPKERETTRRRN